MSGCGCWMKQSAATRWCQPAGRVAGTGHRPRNPIGRTGVDAPDVFDGVSTEHHAEDEAEAPHGPSAVSGSELPRPGCESTSSGGGVSTSCEPMTTSDIGPTLTSLGGQVSDRKFSPPGREDDVVVTEEDGVPTRNPRDPVPACRAPMFSPISRTCPTGPAARARVGRPVVDDDEFDGPGQCAQAVRRPGGGPPR